MSLWNDLIHKSEVISDRWLNTSIVRFDGQEEFRELPRFGNRHAIFPINEDFGTVHYDQHNATDFPTGTINHLAQYTTEKTGIPEDLARIGLVLGGLYAGYKLLKYFGGD